MKVNTPIRNARPLPDGGVDCEILHPAFGWIPFTARDSDPEPHGKAIHAEAERLVNAASRMQQEGEP